ncbi:hypothetical protein HK100_001150 [Physocladia obscura]|uniref:AB hydrolase-1 domain-containing protein n=1 Tax=Physocladia obscura TaxID=109957 RepID=A0AAD5XGD5_9FUNG|nr:hypothetical protein HK100_001150 [Physocladia obscura]
MTLPVDVNGLFGHTDTVNQVANWLRNASALSPSIEKVVYDGAVRFPALFGVVTLVLFAIIITVSLESKVRLIHAKETVLLSSFNAQKTRVEKTALASLVRAKCPSLARGSFRPTLWLPTGHAQTVYAGLISKFPELRVDYDREICDLPDGGLVAIDWAPKNYRDLAQSSPILILLHGLAGGSRETYICDLVPEALKLGYRVAALNYRGCGGMEIATPQLYSGSWTNDVRLLTKKIQAENPTAPLIGIGWSLGANILLKCVGEDSTNSPLVACVSIANPFDLNMGLSFLHNTWLGKELYSRVMTKSLISIFAKHRNLFEKNPDHPSFSATVSSSKILASKFLPDFDEAVTRRVFGFRSVSEYYRMGSSAQFIPDVAIPTLLLNDVNDPIAARKCIPVSDVLANPNIILATTERGGHIGWFEGLFFPKRWFPKPVLEFVKAVLEVS